MAWGLQHRVLQGVRSIGVDEIHWGRRKEGDGFLTVSYQIDAGLRRLLWVGPRRRASSLKAGLDALGPEVIAGLEFVCSDMWKPYLKVTVRYVDGRPAEVTDVVVSTQHGQGTLQELIRSFVSDVLLPVALGPWHHTGIRLWVNPTGEFVTGGPVGDCGVTGRKIIVDTYGGAARHGGGAFSGKDASKVDRSAAYFARYVARQILKAGLARRAELQVAYAIGVAQPVSILVDTFGTGDAEAARIFANQFDFRPAAICRSLRLTEPLFRRTTNYGHFGKSDLPWEQ